MRGRSPAAPPGGGWTLVELLVALSVMLITGGMMFSLLLGAWRIWDGIAGSAAWSARAAAWLERFDADLSGALPAAGLDIQGDEAGLELLRTAQRDGPCLLNVQYTWDGDETLVRIETKWEWPASQGAARSARPVESRLVLGDFELSYGVYEPGRGLVWQRLLGDAAPSPDAVRMRMAPPGGGAAIERLILLPPGPLLGQQRKDGA